MSREELGHHGVERFLSRVHVDPEPVTGVSERDTDTRIRRSALLWDSPLGRDAPWEHFCPERGRSHPLRRYTSIDSWEDDVGQDLSVLSNSVFRLFWTGVCVSLLRLR